MRQLGMALALVASVLLEPTHALAWNDTGHMVVARIAYLHLKPAVRKKVIELLQKHPGLDEDLKKGMPEDFPDPNFYVFLKAATWPDIIRDDATCIHKAENKPKWHFIDYPFVPPANCGKVQPRQPEEDGGEVDNILKAMRKCVSDLRAADKVSEDRRAVSLSWLLHLAGDIHQPLHCTSLFSSQFPGGDQGGNAFLVHHHSGQMPLHTFWDHLLGVSTSPRVLDMLAGKIQADYPREVFANELKSGDFRAWAKESFADACDVAYDGGKLRGASDDERKKDPTVPIPPLPIGYEETAREVARKRIALAGYRLSDQLNSLFKE